ncbi:hypothetical protein OTU49_014180, partial [Cherax quadricarinatus]
MSYSHGSQSNGKPHRTAQGFGEEIPGFGDFRSRFSCDRRPDLSDRFRSFSPSARKSGEEILRDLKEQLRREGDMFFNSSSPDWGFSPKFMFNK